MEPPTEAITLASFVRRHADVRPGALAWSDRRQDVTFGDFAVNVERAAAALAGGGLSRGDRIALLCRNDATAFELLFAAAGLGVVTVAINWRLAPAEIAFILDDSCARILFVGEDFAEAATDAVAACGERPEIIALGDDYTVWRDRPGSKAARPDTGATNDVLCQLYTSGTTGHPKGVMLTQQTFFEQMRSERMAGDIAIGEDDVTLVCSPVFHIGGLGMAMLSFQNGAATILCESAAADIAAAFGQHEITTTFMVPSLIQTLLDDPEFRPERARSLRVLRYGASPITASLLERTRAFFDCGLAQMYGMTECTGAVTCLRPADHDLDSELLQSCGRALPGVELRIVDGEGVSLEAGETGEVWVRSPAMMAGYWNRPDATHEACEGNWYRSGDAGYLDANGYLFLRDRIKDMIVSGGENIYPAEVESALCAHEGVAEAAVIGVPDPRWGEAVKAFVVLESGCTADESGLLRATRRRIASYKLPKSIEFVDALPRNGAGKVLRRELREAFWESSGRQIA